MILGCKAVQPNRAARVSKRWLLAETNSRCTRQPLVARNVFEVLAISCLKTQYSLDFRRNRSELWARPFSSAGMAQRAEEIENLVLQRLRPRTKQFAVRLLAASAFLLFTSAASGQDRQKDAAIFRAICGTCHSTSLVEGLRTETEWREEVDQMIKIGARGTDEQLQAVMRFLVRTLTKVNVNAAAATEIAPVLDVPVEVAERVVKWRTANGAFKTIQDLKQVPGLDPATVDARKDRLLFGDGQ